MSVPYHNPERKSVINSVPEYTPYRGFEFTPFECGDDNCIKYLNEISRDGKSAFFVDISSYEFVTEAEFHQLVDEYLAT